MGLIKTITKSASGVLGEQWKEYFYCDSMPSDVLVTKGYKKVQGLFSSRTESDNIISNGSVIAVNDGQCVIIVEQGKIVDFCADPGEYTYDISTEPSLFKGDLEDTVMDVFENIGKRFTFGGIAPKDQRVYFVNTKELIGNKYGTPSPVPFRVVDQNIGLDMDISIRCFGEYSYRIANPLLFYTNVCANVRHDFTRDELDGQLKSELMTALQPAFAKISAMGIRYSALPGHTMELANVLNEVLSEKWNQIRGIQIVSVGISSVKASEEDEAMIKELQRNAAFRNPAMAAAHIVGAQASAMQKAAENTNAGSMMAFAGMNMAGAAGGVDAKSLFAMGQMQQSQNTGQKSSDEWVCKCGTSNSGKFCSECGNPKPVSEEWVCKCGTINKGKFCSECGSPKPVSEEWICKCGAVNKGKFCNECGSPRS